MLTTGPKISCLVEPHAGVDVGQHRRVHKVALAVQAVAAGDDLDTVALALVDEAHDAGELLLADQRAADAALFAGCAELEGVGHHRDAFHYTVIDAALGEDPRPADAALAGVHEDAHRRHQKMALSRSASSKISTGDLPPSSSVTFFRLSADARTISLPTSVEPVNATFSTSGCAVIAAPAVWP